jgi:diguanylate cyclase (GGDEF)-like protein
MLRVEFLCLYFSMAAFLYFLKSLYPSETSAKFTTVSLYITATYTLITLCLGPKWFTLTLGGYQLFICAGIAYTFYVVFMAIHNKRDGAIITALGFITLGVAVLNDILNVNAIISTIDLTGAGLFLFTFSKSYVLSQHISKAFTSVENMSEQLLQLNNSLDHLVRERTCELERSKAELEEANRSLQLLSHVDGLTNISNRRYFEETLERLWHTCNTVGSPLSCLLMDVDYFKKYNDTYGHLAGDECLKQVAKTLKNTLPDNGAVLARYGGEEFVVLLPGKTEDEAVYAAKSLINEIFAMKLPHESSETADYVTLSCGVATEVPGLTNSPHDLINKADQALYLAKRTGRNCVYH